MNLLQPKISVTMPVYNHAHYLPEALDTLFSQTYQNFELIVINDGSTDNTPDVLRDYQQRYEFTVVHQSNQGLPRALNKGFSLSQGDYLTWTSSDNITLPTMLEKLCAALDSDPSLGVAYADWINIDEVGNPISEFKTLDYDRYLLLHHNYVHCCFLFRKKCIDVVGGYDPEFIYGEDWEFWIRVSQCFRMKHIPEALYKYRIHDHTMTTEILEGTAKNKMSDIAFRNRIRSRSPIAFYYSKIKWKWMTLRLGYDPRLEWMRVIHQYKSV